MLNRFIFVVASLLSFQSWADDVCKIDIQLGQVINDRHIRVLKDHRTVVQYNRPAQVIVNGEVMQLNEEDAKLVEKYITLVSDEVPEYIDIIVDGAELASSWIKEMAATLHGEDTENHNRVKAQVEHVVWKITEKFNHKDENFYLGPQSLNTLEQTINEQFTEEMKTVLSGNFNIMVAAIIDDSDDFGSKMREFGLKLEHLSEDVIAKLEKKAGRLDDKSQEFCQKLIAIDLLETKMQHQIPELDDYNVYSIR